MLGVCADEMRPGLTILKNMGATAVEIEPEPGVAQLGQVGPLYCMAGALQCCGPHGSHHGHLGPAV